MFFNHNKTLLRWQSAASVHALLLQYCQASRHSLKGNFRQGRVKVVGEGVNFSGSQPGSPLVHKVGQPGNKQGECRNHVLLEFIVISRQMWAELCLFQQKQWLLTSQMPSCLRNLLPMPQSWLFLSLCILILYYTPFLNTIWYCIYLFACLTLRSFSSLRQPLPHHCLAGR